MPINQLQALMMNHSFLGYIEFDNFLDPKTNDRKDAMIRVEYHMKYDAYHTRRSEKFSVSPNEWDTDAWRTYKVEDFEVFWENIKTNHQDVSFIVYEVNDVELDIFPHYRDGCWGWELNED